jgi:restriction endonuclease S subunit
MKKEWQTRILGDVCTIASALVDPGKTQYKEMVHVGGANIESTTGALVELKTAEQEGLKSGKFVFDETMVLYSKIRPYLMKVARPDFSGLCSADIYPLTPDPSVLDRGYLFHQLLSPRFTEFAVSGSARAGMPKVNRDHLFTFQLLVPPLPEQQRIVSVLDEAFEGIATAKANAETNLQNARALFESHLQSVFTRCGPGWVESKLNSVTTKIGSGATPRGGEESYKAEGISLIRSLNVHDLGFRYPKLAFLDDAQADELSNVEVKPCDVLLNITGASVARCCIVPQDVLPARVNQHVSIIRPTADRVNPGFLHYLLISKPYKDQLLQTGEEGGSTRQAITKAQIQDFSVEYPATLKEQETIVAKLDAMLAETQCLAALYERKLAVLAALKKSLLHQAFIGEL